MILASIDWGELSVLATGIAISPIPAAAVILVLMSKRGTANGLSFLVGWLVALLLTTGGGALLIQGFTKPEAPEGSVGLSIARIVFGVVLLLLAFRFGWRFVHRDREEPKVPAWLRMIDSFGLSKAALLGFVLAIANIKNLPLALEAAAVLSTAAKEQRSVFCIGLLAFIFVASLSVIVPVVATYLGKETANRLLKGWKHWLQDHNMIILCVLFLFLGVRALVRGVLGL